MKRWIELVLETLLLKRRWNIVTILPSSCTEDLLFQKIPKGSCFLFWPYHVSFLFERWYRLPLLCRSFRFISMSVCLMLVYWSIKQFSWKGKYDGSMVFFFLNKMMVQWCFFFSGSCCSLYLSLWVSVSFEGCGCKATWVVILSHWIDPTTENCH